MPRRRNCCRRTRTSSPTTPTRSPWRSGRNLEGEPFALVKRALAADPDHIKALALAGTAEFERRNYPGAIAYWERILKVVPPDSEFTRSVIGSIAEARGLAGTPAPRP